jgi:hypothetical protein
MDILLNPSKSNPHQLRDIYAKALREATKLYIASAYLTNWDAKQKLGHACKELVFIVGTNFGLSRKAAMHAVLRWMPKRGSCLFLAVPPNA